jgi:hypothetical protein
MASDRSTNYQTREDYNDEAVLHHDKAWMEGLHDSSEAHPLPINIRPQEMNIGEHEHYDLLIQKKGGCIGFRSGLKIAAGLRSSR